MLRFHSPWVPPAKFLALVVNRARDWLSFACILPLIGWYILPYITECKAEVNRSPGQGTRTMSSTVRTRSLRRRDRVVSVNDINMAVYMSTQPLLSNRGSHVILNRTVFVFYVCLFLTRGTDRILFYIFKYLLFFFICVNIIYIHWYVYVSSFYTHGRENRM